MLLIVRQDNGLLGPPFAGPHLLVSLGHENRNNYRRDYSCIVLYDLLSYRDPTCLPLNLYPLEIPPNNLLEIDWGIGTSSHTAKLAEKNRGMVHGGPEVMKDQVLMNLGVAQLKDASLQSCLEPHHVQ